MSGPKPVPGRLEGEVALVTGAAQGLGLAAAQRLAAEGARVAVTDRDGDGAQAAAAGIDGARAYALDVAERDQVFDVAGQVANDLGAVTILVTNAGIQRVGASEQMPRAMWDQTVAVNLDGVWDCIQAVSPEMLKAKHGAIVNIASINSYRGMPGRAPYCATKTAILGLTRALACEWATRGVRVNAVAPGYALTPMVKKAIDEGLVDEPQLLDRIPARELTMPEDVAAAIAFLVSGDARMVTGQCIPVDGGYLAYGAPRPSSELPEGFAS